jgi:hypothetical protein
VQEKASSILNLYPFLQIKRLVDDLRAAFDDVVSEKRCVGRRFEMQGLSRRKNIVTNMLVRLCELSL